MTIAFVVYTFLLTFIKVSIFSDIIKITHTKNKNLCTSQFLMSHNSYFHFFLSNVSLYSSQFQGLCSTKNLIKYYNFFAIFHIPNIQKHPKNPLQDII